MVRIGSVRTGIGPAVAAGLLVATAFVASTAAAADASRFHLYSVKASFADARQDLKDAIINRGLVVDNVSHIGKMLQRTAKAVHATRRIYLDAEAFQFCSAVYSRRMMEADPRNILFCPYVVVLYRTADRPDVVHIGYRRPDLRGSAASKAALKAVDKLLDGIVREAAGVK